MNQATTENSARITSIDFGRQAREVEFWIALWQTEWEWRGMLRRLAD